MSDRGDALAERLFGALLGAIDVQTVYLGDRLGLYAALAEGGSATSGELAARTGVAERYAREWLEQQAVGSILDCDDPSAAPRRAATPCRRITPKCCSIRTRGPTWCRPLA